MVDYIVPQRFYGTSLYVARIVGAYPLLLARFRAGWRLRLRPFAPGMTCRRNGFSLARKLFPADRTVDYLVIRACIFACRGLFVFAYRLACNVTLCGNFLIRRVITARACIVCFPTCLGACCFFSFVMYDIVPQCFYGMFIYVTRIIGAYPLLLARFRTGWRLRLRPLAPRVARCFNRPCFQHFVANRALLVSASCLFARCGGIYYPLAPRVAGCGDFLPFQHFVANRALLVSASRLLARRGGIYYPFARRVAGCGDFLRFQHFVTDRALLVPASRLLARRGGIYYPFACCMAGCRDFLICRIVTARTCIVCSPACLGTRCLFSFVMDYIVPQRFYRTNLHVARIVGANPLLLARFRAGWRLCLRPLAPRMAGCGDFLPFQYFVADRALLMPASRLFARCGFVDYPFA